MLQSGLVTEGDLIGPIRAAFRHVSLCHALVVGSIHSYSDRVPLVSCIVSYVHEWRKRIVGINGRWKRRLTAFLTDASLHYPEL